MRRSRIDLDAITDPRNLSDAFYKAAKGKRLRDDVRLFCNDFEANINALADDIRGERLPYNRYRSFRIYDPKPRLIHAACFPDRIFHHALINLAGGVLERAMTRVSYACRCDMGVHRAVERVQRHLRRFDYYCKIDIRGYFANIDHGRMLGLLARRFKGEPLLAQWGRLLAGYHTLPGRGLPIGSLTSQYCANYYLDGLDRFLLDQAAVRACVRYMDDIVWWCDSRQEARATLTEVVDWLDRERGLTVKPNRLIQQSSRGITYCGYRILPGTIRLTRRRKRRYLARRQYWENLYTSGIIDALQLQQAYAAVQAITVRADCSGWLRENLRRYPPITV